MRQSEIVSALQASGIPIFFARVKKKRPPPLIILSSGRTANFFADDALFMKKRIWRAMLVTTDKSPDDEARLENALNAAGICWDIDDEFPVDTEGLYHVIYEFEELEAELYEPDEEEQG